mmetsp:Transcript_27253/g.55650  ORF Transcript_27253/g.55650 Transcript_27253/m.55650 type:complete len:204 (-) Transcript_27253:1420-2031(-)
MSCASVRPLAVTSVLNSSTSPSQSSSLPSSTELGLHVVDAHALLSSNTPSQSLSSPSHTPSQSLSSESHTSTPPLHVSSTPSQSSSSPSHAQPLTLSTGRDAVMMPAHRAVVAILAVSTQNGKSARFPTTSSYASSIAARAVASSNLPDESFLASSSPVRAACTRPLRPSGPSATSVATTRMLNSWPAITLTPSPADADSCSV